MRLLLAVVFGALSACSSRPCNPSVYDVVGRSVAPHVGVTDYFGASVALDPRCEKDEWFARLVAAHELGHVLGVPHLYGARCFMSPEHWPGEDPIWAPSDRELALVRVRDPKRLHLDPTLGPVRRAAVAWAVGVWNKALGLDAFSVD